MKHQLVNALFAALADPRPPVAKQRPTGRAALPKDEQQRRLFEAESKRERKRQRVQGTGMRRSK